MKLYVDMDQVLTDFNQNYKNHSGELPSQTRQTKGKEVFKNNVESYGEDFWANMPWTKDGKQLWDYVKQFNPIVLTAPMSVTGCKSGKMKWAQRELGPNVRVVITTQKFRHAKPGSILVDDYEKNTKAWETSKGTGILHTSARDSINKLKKLVGIQKESKEWEDTVTAAWITPNGDFINIGFAEHAAYVEEHIKQFNISYKEYSEFVKNDIPLDKIAIMKGAVKIHHLNNPRDRALIATGLTINIKVNLDTLKSKATSYNIDKVWINTVDTHQNYDIPKDVFLWGDWDDFREYESVHEGRFSSAALAALLAGSSFLPSAQAKHEPKKVERTMTAEVPSSQLIDILVARIKNLEGFSPTAYADKGHFTIGYGHQLGPGEKYPNGITKQEAEGLLKTDIVLKIQAAKRLFPAFYSFPIEIQVSLVDGVYRGEHRKEYKTTKLINAGRWKEAAEEYLNNREYLKAKKQKSGIAKRMEANYYAMKEYGDRESRQVASL